MALMKGFSNPSISKNAATEIRSGRKPASGGGMAYSMAKKAKAQGYAEGGVVGSKHQAMLDRIFKKKMSVGGVVDDDYEDETDVVDDYPEDFEETHQDDIGEEGLAGPALTVSSNEDDARKKLLQGIFIKRALRGR